MDDSTEGQVDIVGVTDFLDFSGEMVKIQAQD
jgi:hypothetical protein